MTQNRVDLASIFGAVTQALAQNQQAFNQADTYNQDHGSNMVQTFQTITDAIQTKKGKSDSSALAYAAKALAKSSTSSSGKLYAQGLANAAANFKGKNVDQAGALDLLQTLIGGGQSPPQGGPSAGNDMLSSILGQLTGGGKPQPGASGQPGGDMLSSVLSGLAGSSQAPAQTAPTESGDILSSLLGSLTGSQAPSHGAGSGTGLDVGDLLNAGMSFMQAKQSGGSTTQALVQAFIAASGMGNSPHRTQSTATVVSSFLQALGGSGAGH